MQPRMHTVDVQLSAEVTSLLDEAARARGLSREVVFGHAIDRLDPAAVVDTSPGPGPLQPRAVTLSAAQAAQWLSRATQAGLSDEDAAIAAIRQLAAAKP